MFEPNSPLTVDVKTAAQMTSLSPHTIRLYLRTGRLQAVKCGRRVLIPVESLRKLVGIGCPRRTSKDFALPAQATA